MQCIWPHFFLSILEKMDIKTVSQLLVWLVGLLLWKTQESSSTCNIFKNSWLHFGLLHSRSLFHHLFCFKSIKYLQFKRNSVWKWYKSKSIKVKPQIFSKTSQTRILWQSLLCLDEAVCEFTPGEVIRIYLLPWARWFKTVLR